jgi:multidrug efflux system outer membrane protein
MISCSVGPSYTPPAIEVPSEWKNKQDRKCAGFETSEEGELVYLDHWWQVFDDAKLEELEDWAIKNNRDLFVAFERIQEARSLMGIAASYFYPQITLNPLTTHTVELIKNYRNSQLLKNIATNGNNGNAMNNGTAGLLSTLNSDTPFRVHEVLYSLPINMSYEVDLWGKIRDQYDSEAYNWLAKQKDYEFVMLSLTSNLASAYYQLRAADSQIDLLLKILKTRQKAFKINQDRYEEQITFYADVTLAAEEIDIVLNQYHEVIRQRNVLEDQIAILIGAPASEFSLEHMPLPLEKMPPCIPEGIPSDVLLRRPDIAEAEYNVQSQHALVKRAYSLFYPSLILTATAGFESPTLKDFLKWISRYWMDSLQINQLIFDGFRTPYYLELQIARFQEASGSYQQQVLVAFQEVEDALTSLESYGKQYDVALATTQWAQKTNQLYLDRYLLGVSYYINVANTERDLLNYQLTLTDLQGFRYLATIQLIKALGGGW